MVGETAIKRNKLHKSFLQKVSKVKHIMMNFWNKSRLWIFRELEKQSLYLNREIMISAILEGNSTTKVSISPGGK